MRWDNITILQAVDRHQERFGGGDVWGVDGRQLMEEIAGRQVTEDQLSRGFIRELEIAAGNGYLTFSVEIYGGIRSRPGDRTRPVSPAGAQFRLDRQGPGPGPGRPGGPAAAQPRRR